MPAVTLPAARAGLPTATTSWPTCSWLVAERHGPGTSPRARSTARSKASADYIDGGLGAIDERSGYRAGTLDHMGAGQHEAIVGQHTRAAPLAASGPEARHARQDPLTTVVTAAE